MRLPVTSQIASISAIRGRGTGELAGDDPVVRQRTRESRQLAEGARRAGESNLPG